MRKLKLALAMCGIAVLCAPARAAVSYAQSARHLQGFRDRQPPVNDTLRDYVLLGDGWAAEPRVLRFANGPQVDVVWEPTGPVARGLAFPDGVDALPADVLLEGGGIEPVIVLVSTVS